MKESAWKKTPPAIEALLDKQLGGLPCDKRTMFGHPAYFIEGNMFAGGFGDAVFLRLGVVGAAQAIAARGGALPFSPLKGRVMREYVALPAAVFQDPAAFALWIKKSFAHVMSLPPKAGKAKKKR